jgi:hypothetical protein
MYIPARDLIAEVPDDTTRVLCVLLIGSNSVAEELPHDTATDTFAAENLDDQVDILQISWEEDIKTASTCPYRSFNPTPAGSAAKKWQTYGPESYASEIFLEKENELPEIVTFAAVDRPVEGITLLIDASRAMTVSLYV